MTALELAQELEYYHLEPILAPVIHQPVPAPTLDKVQLNFHALLREDLGHLINEHHIQLPVLEMLTELTMPLMWFQTQMHRVSPTVRCSARHTFDLNVSMLNNLRGMHIDSMDASLSSNHTTFVKLVPSCNIGSRIVTFLSSKTLS